MDDFRIVEFPSGMCLVFFNSKDKHATFPTRRDAEVAEASWRLYLDPHATADRLRRAVVSLRSIGQDGRAYLTKMLLLRLAATDSACAFVS